MANGLTGYQFDKMRISPSKDALMYWGLQNGGQDHIIYGYKSNFLCEIDATGTTVTVHPGAAIVGGRLIELQSDQTLSVPSGTGTEASVYIQVDLTKTNTSSGSTNSTNYVVDNNQVSLGIDKIDTSNGWNSVGAWNSNNQLNYTTTGFSNTSQKLYIAVFDVSSGTNSARRSQSGKFTANVGSFLPLDKFVQPGWKVAVGDNSPNSSDPLLGNGPQDGAGIYRDGDICYLTCDFVATQQMGSDSIWQEFVVAKIPQPYAQFFMPLGRPSYAVREGSGNNYTGWFMLTTYGDSMDIKYVHPHDYSGYGHVIRNGATLKSQGQTYPALPVNTTSGDGKQWAIWN